MNLQGRELTLERLSEATNELCGGEPEAVLSMFDMASSAMPKSLSETDRSNVIVQSIHGSDSQDINEARLSAQALVMFAHVHVSNGSQAIVNSTIEKKRGGG